MGEKKDIGTGRGPDTSKSDKQVRDSEVGGTSDRAKVTSTGNSVEMVWDPNAGKYVPAGK